jgi:hypothetical protein
MFCVVKGCVIFFRRDVPEKYTRIIGRKSTQVRIYITVGLGEN